MLGPHPDLIVTKEEQAVVVEAFRTSSFSGANKGWMLALFLFSRGIFQFCFVQKWDSLMLVLKTAFENRNSLLSQLSLEFSQTTLRIPNRCKNTRGWAATTSPSNIWMSKPASQMYSEAKCAWAHIVYCFAVRKVPTGCGPSRSGGLRLNICWPEIWFLGYWIQLELCFLWSGLDLPWVNGFSTEVQLENFCLGPAVHIWGKEGLQLLIAGV